METDLTVPENSSYWGRDSGGGRGIYGTYNYPHPVTSGFLQAKQEDGQFWQETDRTPAPPCPSRESLRQQVGYYY